MTLPSLRSVLVFGVFLVASTCNAGTVTAKLGWPTNNQQIKICINDGNGGAATASYGFAGFIPWTQSPANNNKALANTFYSFCIELTQDVYINSTYTFALQSLATSPTPGSSHNGAGAGMGAAKADAIARLWNGFYGTLSPTLSLDKKTALLQLENAAAFQLAIWRIEYDWTAGQTAASLENFNGTGSGHGNFRTNNSSGNAEATVDIAQTLLGYVFDPTTAPTTALKAAYATPAIGLVAMTDPNHQDQVTQALPGSHPLPSPEPTSMCLALIGGLGLSAFGYRRRKAIPQAS